MEIEAEKKQMIHKTFAFNLMLTLVYCGLIFFQSSHPSPYRLPDIPFMDKILHGLGYALLGILCYRTFETAPPRISGRKVIIMAVIASTLYGISDEIHQYFVPARQADVIDGAMDAVGSMFGVAVYHYILAKYPFWSTRNLF